MPLRRGGWRQPPNYRVPGEGLQHDGGLLTDVDIKELYDRSHEMAQCVLEKTAHVRYALHDVWGMAQATVKRIHEHTSIEEI